jgi:DMSO/TMAO reductase YedYZ heme-binding membrane subunit
MTAVSLTWLLTRSTGIVAWALIVASCVWGVLLATRALASRGVKRPSPAWIFSIHRFLGGLAVIFTAIHVGAILVDSFVSFSIVDALVPFASSSQTLAIALGVVAMYLLVAIEVTSLLRDRMPPRVWRSVHLLAYALLALTTVHALAAGTDVQALVPTAIAVVAGCVVAFGCGLAWQVRRDRQRSQPRGPAPSRPAPSRPAPSRPGAPLLPRITIGPRPPARHGATHQ